MNRLQLQAILRLAIGVVMLTALAIIFLSGGGAESYSGDKARKLTLAAVLGAGYLGLFLTLFLTRGRKAGGRVMVDERDERIIRLANGFSAVVLGVVVFIGSIALYEWYYDAGAVPVGWMWFVAYASSFIAITSHAAAMLLLYGRMGANGQS